MKKECTGCKKTKLITDFYKKNDRETGHNLCKSCFNQYCVSRWQKRKIQAIEYKGGRCVDCGFDHPTYPPDIFEFHHLNPNEKEFDWNKLKLTSWNKIVSELDKCVLLCANCHRIRHYNLNLVAPTGIEPVTSA